MLATRRHGWITRLAAATLSLALVVASVVGAAAHGGACAHHAPHYHHSHAGDDADHDASHSGSQAHVKSGPVSHADSGTGESHVQHQTCMDFVCHGGIAVLAA